MRDDSDGENKEVERDNRGKTDIKTHISHKSIFHPCKLSTRL